ncbi:uncharacterized MFS-type transporter C09D4.1-like [Panonychus citri]|uniref:uncharacterized MFS-type transporter C09D4.1-like n=1 Tax=Panonychus citri TaxID=50023 RepID=UPI002307A878|nr:uncharacterized MFS-type transporter C09D4.1-like [Panonychus citri]XP_053202395.1 uncharacterized MFS-type transporter C09D4.1-like [Panonychus citri]
MDVEIKLSKQRFLVLGLHCLTIFHINSQWTQFQVIADVCRSYFNVTNTDLDWTVTIWYPVYMVGCFISAICLDKIGIRFCILMASLANLAGSAVKYFSIVYSNFILVCFGQALAAVGQVFTFFLPVSVASTWFPAEIASTITAVALFPIYIGGGLGYLLPTLFVPNDTTPSVQKTDLKRFHLVYTISAGVILVINLIFFKNRPKHPPSLASAKASVNGAGFLKAWRSILTNRNSNFILVSYTFLQSITNVVLALLSPMVEKDFPGQNSFIGILGAVVAILSIPGSGALAWVTDRTRKYRLVTLLMCIFMFPLFGLFIYSLKVGSKIFVFIIVICLGLLLEGTFPIGMDFIVQANYPMSESICATLMMFCNQGVSWAATDAVSYLLHNYNLYYAFTPILLMTIIALISAIFTKDNLNRDAANTESTNIIVSSISNQNYSSTSPTNQVITS